jgi:hypothetical protein
MVRSVMGRCAEGRQEWCRMSRTSRDGMGDAGEASSGQSWSGHDWQARSDDEIMGEARTGPIPVPAF